MERYEQFYAICGPIFYRVKEQLVMYQNNVSNFEYGVLYAELVNQLSRATDGLLKASCGRDYGDGNVYNRARCVSGSLEECLHFSRIMFSEEHELYKELAAFLPLARSYLGKAAEERGKYGA